MNNVLITLSADQRTRLLNATERDSTIWNTLRRALHARPVVLGARNVEYVIVCDHAKAAELRDIAQTVCREAVENIDLACRTALHHTQLQAAQSTL